MAEVRIPTEARHEFGKGAARRMRRAERIPGVLYGHGKEPRHFTLPGHELMLALRTPNVLLRLTGNGVERGETLAIPKQVQRDPLKGFLQHVDLLLVRRGEQVEVDIPLSVVGEIVAGGMLDQQEVQVRVEAEATNIPGEIGVDVTGMEVGASVHAGDLDLPRNTSLAGDEEQLLLQVIGPQGAETAEAVLAAEEAEAGVDHQPTREEAQAPAETGEPGSSG